MMLHHPVRYRTRTIRRSRHRSLTLVLFAATLATPLSAGSAQSQEKLAEITGGVDETRQNYYWTVVNNYSSPIVHVEFPHHRADRFQIIPSTGWEQECTYLVNVGVPDKPGVCIAKAKAPNPGIPPGARHDFSMGITAKGALVGQGQVTIRFADGKTVSVPGVTLPVPPPASFKFLPLVGAAIIFGLWVFTRTLREHRRKRQETGGAVAGSDQNQGQGS